MKKLCVVLRAIKDGCNTTRDIADVTGYSVAVASALVSEAEKAGFIRKTGRIMKDARPGGRFHVFEPCGTYWTK